MRNLKSWMILIPVIILAGCKDNNIEEISLLKGTFSGTIEYDNSSLNVIVDFIDTTFEAIIYNSKLPEMCHGNFTQASTTLVFNNTCKKKSNLNWKNILSGNYQYTFNGKTLILWKDEVRLKLQKEKEKYFYKL